MELMGDAQNVSANYKLFELYYLNYAHPHIHSQVSVI